MSAGHLRQYEVVDILADLESQYSRAVASERMDSKASTFEFVVCTTTEVAESLVTFRWSKLAKKLFALRHERIETLEREARAPGREIAYIVKARERFGK